MRPDGVTAPEISWLTADMPPDSFPDVERALREPDGLLAAGGDLSAERLLSAYPKGIFPWYDSGQPILWWSPDPRCVIHPAEFHVSRSLRRAMRQSKLRLSFNGAFAQVIEHCAERLAINGSNTADAPPAGTWITAEMKRAYIALHRQGWAHSVELWDADNLVGGVYGLAIGRVFFGESMFSHQSNASKMALYCLCRHLSQHRFGLLDCQLESAHLLSLGAVCIPRATFSAALASYCRGKDAFNDWPRNPAGPAQLIG